MNDLEKMSIERLKAASDMSLMAYKQPLVICISGGKDSSVITELAVRSGIPCEFQHNHTTADAPETVRFVRSEFRRLEELGYKCTVNMPIYKGQRTSMWSLIPQKLMPPTRFMRYCCSILKEPGGAGRFICTGVRWAESKSRKNSRGIFEKLGATKAKKIILANDNDEKRMLFENCRLKAKRVVNPIIDWADEDVYGFLEDAKVPMNPLYVEGQCRVGCIGCPLAKRKSREAEFARWPKYKQLYLNAFGRMLEERKQQNKKFSERVDWVTAEDVFRWWMEYDVLPGQISTEDYLEMMNE